MKKNFALLFLIAFLSVALFICIGFYAHCAGDDYVFAYVVMDHGFWEAQAVWFNEWTGRYATNFLLSLITLFDLQKIYQWLSLLWGLFSLVAIMFFLNPFYRTKLPQRSFSGERLSMSFVLLAIFFAVIPGLNENFYFCSGSLYFFSCMLFLIQLAVLFRLCETNRNVYLICLSTLSFINAGLLEIASVSQILLFFFIAAVSFYLKKYELTRKICIVLLASLMGLTLVLLSPGTVVRTVAIMVAGATPGNIFRTVKVALIGGLLLFVEFFSKPIIYVLLLFLPTVKKHFVLPDFTVKLHLDKVRLWHIFVLELLTACGFQFIGGWALGEVLPMRAEGTALFFMLLEWMFFFIFCFQNEKFACHITSLRVFNWRYFALMLCLLLNVNFLSAIYDLRVGPEYSRQLDERCKYIKEEKEAGTLDLVVPALSVYPKMVFFFEDEVAYDVCNWSNVDCAKYWGLNSIRTAIVPALSAARAGDIVSERKALAILAESGDRYAQFFMYDFLRYSDPEHSISWLRRAANNGHRLAATRMLRGLARNDPIYVSKVDGLSVIRWYLVTSTTFFDMMDL